jgi:hypothetical protein
MLNHVYYLVLQCMGCTSHTTTFQIGFLIIPGSFMVTISAGKNMNHIPHFPTYWTSLNETTTQAWTDFMQ